MLKKRIGVIFCVFLLVFSVVLLNFIIFNKKTVVASADGRAETVMELTTNTVVLSKNGDKKLPMASTTKIMTALLIIEECNLEKEITVAQQAVGVEGSSIYLKHGEKISIADLVYGLMLRSGNDAAVALAIEHSGSVEAFVNKMNEKAKEIGAKSTHFTNPSGLPDENHYTTANDLCLIACTALNNQTFAKVVSTKNYCGKYRNFVNKNKFLFNYEGANGVKTGYTVKAGRCLVTSAERDGVTFVCVVLDCPDMYERSEKLLDECFDRFTLAKIDKNTVFMSDRVPCTTGIEYKFLVEKGAELDYKVENCTSGKKIKAGDKVGKLLLFCRNNLIFEGNLYSIVDR